MAKVSPNGARPTHIHKPERRRSDRRRTKPALRVPVTNAVHDILVHDANGRRATDAPSDRRTVNMLRRGCISDLQENVEARLGWAGVHGIRGWSGLGAALATAASVGMVVAAAFTPLIPGLGAVVFVAAYLALTAVGVALQMGARRKRLPLVETQRQELIALRDELRNLPTPANGEEKSQLDAVERLLKDIEGGFWWGMRSALAGFLDPTTMLREGWRGVFGKRDRRQGDRRVQSDRRT